MTSDNALNALNALNMVIANLRPMLEAQVAHAQGLKYLVVRNTRTGRFLRVTELMAKAKHVRAVMVRKLRACDPPGIEAQDERQRVVDGLGDHLADDPLGGP